MEVIINSFKAMSDPVRQNILNLLKTGPKSAGEIAAIFDLKQPTVSHHLKILKECELIIERKEKNFVYYNINSSIVEDMILWLQQFSLKEKK
jgi:ArsR family transcriptional regulator